MSPSEKPGPSLAHDIAFVLSAEAIVALAIFAAIVVNSGKIAAILHLLS